MPYLPLRKAFFADVFLEVFFNFFSCRLTNNANTVVVDCNLLIARSVLVFGCRHNDFLNKFMYRFRRESLKAGNSLCFINSILFSLDKNERAK